MKKRKIYALAGVAVMSAMIFTACGAKNEVVEPAAAETTAETEAAAEAVTEEASAEEPSSAEKVDNGEEAEYVIDISMKDSKEELKADDGKPLLKIEESFPEVTIDGSAAAADNINDFYEEKKADFDSNAEDLKAMAEDDLKMRTEDGAADSFTGYEVSITHEVMRQDDGAVSIVNNTYEYTGGAHPNSVRSAATFDTASGELLTLKELTTDEKAATDFINDYLLKEMKGEQYKDIFFEDYEKDVPSILADDTWYLSKEGFVVIVNEYIVSPHAAGILEFTIPYKDFTLLKDIYKGTE